VHPLIVPGALSALLGLAVSSAAFAQESEPPPPSEEQAPPVEPEPLPPAPNDRRPRLEGGAQGGQPPDAAPAREGALERRRPVLSSTNNRLRSISLEADFGLQLGGVDGEAHAGTGLDYDQLWEGLVMTTFRFQVPLRFLSHHTVGLWAGPLIEIAGGGMQQQNVFVPNAGLDVLVVDDLRVSRVLFGGFFRIEIGRAFMEGWFGLGAGSTSRVDAILDQTSSGGGMTPFVLYERSSMGAVAGGFRVGMVWQFGQRWTLAGWFTVGGWAMGPPDESPSTVLSGPIDPERMAGVFIGGGFTVGFGLGDWPAAHPEPSVEPRRRLG
jgi:hypothetical protein